MRPRVLILTALALLSAVGISLLIGRSKTEEAVPRSVAVKPAAHPAAALVNSPAGAVHVPMDDTATPAPDFAARFRAATNYFEFVRETRPAAKAGNPRAQVYLYRALKSCSMDYQYLFKSHRQKRYLSYDEGLQQAEKRLPFRPEYVRLVHTRCHGLFDPLDPEVENPDEWLRKAAAGLDPLALALAVNRSFASEEEVDGIKIVSQGSTEEDARLAKRQLGTAIRSRDPEVLFEVAHKLHPSDSTGSPSEYINMEWVLAACLRGLDARRPAPP